MLKCHQLSPDTLDNQAAAETYPIFCFTWSISHLVWPEERNLEWIWSCFLFYTRTTTKTTMIHPMTKNCCGILSPHRNEARQGDDAHKRKQPRRSSRSWTASSILSIHFGFDNEISHLFWPEEGGSDFACLTGTFSGTFQQRRKLKIVLSFTCNKILHTVRNLHFLSKISTLISRENCRFFGWKSRENVVVLDFLAVDNFVFTRKIFKKILGEKLVKMLWFWTF